jgi:EthD domain
VSTKLVFCVRRAPDMTLEEFHDRWLNVHGPLVRSLREQVPSMVRYVQSHLVPGEATDQVRASRGTGEPFDGITEVWIDDAAPAGTQEAAVRLLRDEMEFIDMERSSVFFTTEHVIF